MIQLHKYKFAVVVLVSLFNTVPAKSAEDNIVIATIRPLHAIVAAIMEGVGTPRLLLMHQQDAHHASLKPSQIRGLLSASIIFRIGPNMEVFLNPLFKSLDIKGKIATATDFDNLARLTFPDNTPDPHIWLHSENAIAIATGVANTLVEADANNKATYQQNLIKLKNNLTKMKADMSELLNQSQSRKYLVDHDALQYFATEFDLQIRTIGYRNEELTPTAKQIATIRKLIGSKEFSCIIVGNNIGSIAIRAIAEDASIPVIVFDPTGSQFEAGAQQYFKLMRKIAVDIAQCN